MNERDVANEAAVLDIAEVRLSTRSGWRMAVAWAIMPPIELPTRVAPAWISHNCDGSAGGCST